MLILLLARASAERIMVVSDLHYMARSLYEGSDLFIRALRAGDGKVTQYSDELMDALMEAVALEAPDALIVTGDLTFNGERLSHEALARRFRAMEDAGTPVWVLPGNHDINVTTARRFEGDGWAYTDPVTPEGFQDIYADFMGTPGSGANLSYVAPIGEKLNIAMVDASFYEGGAQSFGVFMAGHAAWLDGVLEDCALTATHHSLLPHTEFLKDTFLMLGSESMAAVLKRHEIPLNLSGHIHAQHITTRDGVTDAALGAFCTWPHRYAIVTFEEGNIDYRATSLEASLLPDGFLQMSHDWFYDITRDKLLSGLDHPSAQAMADYAARFNLAFFEGTLDPDDPAWREDAAYALWEEEDDNLFRVYIDTVLGEPQQDNLHWGMGRP